MTPQPSQGLSARSNSLCTNKKRKLTTLLYTVGIALVFVLAVIALHIFCTDNVLARSSMPIPIAFEGEYSQNGGDWQPYSEGTSINALNGDVTLRGRFNFEWASIRLQAYLDHISLRVVVDGKEEYAYPNEGTPEDPVAIWVAWESEAFSAQTVELHLSNLLTIGNPTAYQDFLNLLFVGPKSTFENYILHPSTFLSGNIRYEGMALWTNFLSSGECWRGIGFGISVLALLLLGIALTDALTERMFGRTLWLFAVLTLLAAGVMVLDTKDASLWYDTYYYISYQAQLCRMLWLLAFPLWFAQLCTEYRKKLVYAATAVCVLFDAGVFLLGIFRDSHPLACLPVWMVVQAALVAALSILFVLEWRCRKQAKEKRTLILPLTLLCALGAELLNARLGFFGRGLLINTAFVVVMLIYVVCAIKRVQTAFHRAKLAQKQEKELAQSRVAIMLSQIQPHFLYNALSSIQCLCHDNPAAAEKATAAFSEYLRGNMDSLTMDKPIGFEEELRHVSCYLSLEALRFPDKLKVEYDIQTKLFRLPLLTLQPLVENAVRYGISKRLTGGTVRIATQEQEKRFVITVEDDGAGFDPAQPREDGRTHIGIQNVRSRLEQMCGGTLDIQSTPGVGTVAVITIPKECGQQ